MRQKTRPLCHEYNCTCKKTLNFQYWSVVKINKEVFYTVVTHCKKKKKSSKLRKARSSRWEIMEKLSGILESKHEGFLLLLLKRLLGEKHCQQRNISSETLTHWVANNFILQEIKKKYCKQWASELVVRWM